MQVIGGGFANGKTAASCVKAIRIAKDYPGSNGIIAMATYAQLNDTIREEYFKWVPHNWVAKWPTVANNTLVMKNGSKVNFRYLQQKGKSQADGITSSNLLSATYDYAIVDQIENPAITYKDYLDLFGRLRGSTPYKGTDETMPTTGPRWLILTANPAFNWFYHKVIRPVQLYRDTGQIDDALPYDPDEEKCLVDLFEAATYENQHNLEPDFIKALEATYTGQYRSRYLGGEWGAFEGLVYPSFNPKQHIVPHEQIMQYLFKCKSLGLTLEPFQGYDFGLAEPSAFLFGFTTPGGMPIVVDGFYRPCNDIRFDAEEIHRLYMQYGAYIDVSREPIMADPAIFKRSVFKQSGSGATTIASIFQNDYNLYLKRGQNDITSGIAKVNSYLNINNYPSPVHGYEIENDLVIRESHGPAIAFSNRLPWIANEFSSYFWKMGPHQERIDEPIDRNNHAMDALKYALSYLPSAHEIMFRDLALKGAA